MKKIVLTFVMALFAITTFAQEEATTYRVPSGYQGFLEIGNTFFLIKEMDPTINISTTHGMFMNEHVYIGLGISIDFNDDHTLIPLYANMRYVFANRKAVSPVLGVRLGSFLSNKVGAYGDFTFGARFASKKDFAVSMLLGGTFYGNLIYSYYDYSDCDEYNCPIYYEKIINPFGVSLRIGIEW